MKSVAHPAMLTPRLNPSGQGSSATEAASAAAVEVGRASGWAVEPHPPSHNANAARSVATLLAGSAVTARPNVGTGMT